MGTIFNTILLLSYAFSSHCTPEKADGWKSVADLLLDSIDTSYNPCENFHKFACGKWQEKYAETSGSQPAKTMRGTAERLINIITDIRPTDKSVPRYKRSLKTMYDQCVATGSNMQLAKLYEEIEKVIGPLPLVQSARGEQVLQKRNIYYLLGKLQRKFDLPTLIDMQVRSFQQTCVTRPLLYLSQFEFSIFRPIAMRPFASVLRDLATAINVTLDFGMLSTTGDKLNRLPSPRQPFYQQIGDRNFTIFSLSSLRENVTDRIDWTEYFRGLLPPGLLKEWQRGDPQVGIEDVRYFQHLANTMTRFTYEELMAYMYWKAVSEFIVQHEKSHVEVMFELPNVCIRKVMQQASAASVRALFENYSSNALEWKHDLELLGETILSGAKYLMQTAEWMDLQHKVAMVRRIESMKVLSGIPDWITDDDAVERHTPHYDPRFTMIENDVRMLRKRHLWKLRFLTSDELSKTVYTSLAGGSIQDPEPVFLWNAKYWIKTIELFIGSTVPPMYRYTYPMAAKYGLVGWVIGHEMFHGFHYGGNPTEAFDDVKKLMSPEMLNRFLKRVNCIRRQYSGYCYDDFCLSGSRTINDNIADIDGLKATYMAYKFMSQASGGKEVQSKPPELANYTLDQIFFLSAAQVWCATDKVSDAEKADVHSPARARIELSMINFPAFAQAFRCSSGSRYAPVQYCDLWGDFMEPNVAKKRK